MITPLAKIDARLITISRLLTQIQETVAEEPNLETLGVHFLKKADTKRFLDHLTYCVVRDLEEESWEAGIRTPIGGSRVRSLTVRRPPNKAM